MSELEAIDITKEKFLEVIDNKELEYLEKGLLYFGEANIDNTVDIPTFLQELINNYVNHNYTYDINNNITDEKALHRSIEDIFRITKYYYPDITLKELLTELLKLQRDDKIRSLFCNDILKRTYFTKNTEFSRDYGWEYVNSSVRYYECKFEDHFNLYNFNKYLLKQ